MRIVIFFLFVFSSNILFSQKTKQPKPFTFKIEGTVRNFAGKTVYVHHKWDEKDFTDSAIVENGKFNFKLESIDPNMYWFTLTSAIAAQPNVIFFADKSKVTVTLVGDTLSNTAIAGGQTQKDYVDYKALMTKLAATQQRLQSEYTLAVQKSDATKVKEIQKEYQQSSNDYFSVDLKNFIKTHPASAVSGYIIYREFNNPNVPLELAEECLTLTDKSIANTKFIRLATKRVNDVKGTMIGAVATNFSQETAEGKKVQVTDFRGKYLLIDFWASWCRPCRMENPHVVAAYNKYNGKGLEILGVSLDSNKEQWVMAVKNDQLTWSNVSDLKGGNNEAAVIYGIQTIPQNVLLDRDGKIIAKNLRGADLEAKLEEIFK